MHRTTSLSWRLPNCCWPPYEPTDQRNDQVRCSTRQARSAQRTLKGIDEQGRKAEQTVAGKAAVKRNRFVKLNNATKAVNRELDATPVRWPGSRATSRISPTPRPGRSSGPTSGCSRLVRQSLRKLQFSAANQGRDLGLIPPRTQKRGMPATSDVSVFKCALPRRVRSSYRWSPCNGAVLAMSAAVISPVVPPLLVRDSDRVAGVPGVVSMVRRSLPLPSLITRRTTAPSSTGFPRLTIVVVSLTARSCKRWAGLLGWVWISAKQTDDWSYARGSVGPFTSSAKAICEYPLPCGIDAVSNRATVCSRQLIPV